MKLQRSDRPCYGQVIEPVTLELLGRQLVDLRETVKPRTAILIWIDGTLQGIGVENRSLLRRDAGGAQI